MITLAPTNSSEFDTTVTFQGVDITVIVAVIGSAVAVLTLLVIILIVSLAFSISLWRRAQRKK